MFKKVLIANRGEIALRVIRACRELGVAYGRRLQRRRRARAARARGRRSGPHRRRRRRVESYLKGDRIIEAAKRTGAEAIHPGYGFLSEREWFARAVRDAGLVFDRAAGRGDRRDGQQDGGAHSSRSQRGRAGRSGNDRAARATPPKRATIAEKFGYPVLLKAAAGGGGKGMRVVRSRERDRGGARRRRGAKRRTRSVTTRSTSRSTSSARATSRSRCSATSTATMLSLGERECSVQRRHQKMIEEAPSVAVTPELRRAMGETAVRGRARGRLRERRHVRVPARRGRASSTSSR